MNIFMFQCIWWYTFAMVLIDGCVHDEIKSEDDEYIIVHGYSWLLIWFTFSIFWIIKYFHSFLYHDDMNLLLMFIWSWLYFIWISGMDDFDVVDISMVLIINVFRCQSVLGLIHFFYIFQSREW